MSGASGAFSDLAVTVPSRMTAAGEEARTSPEELLAGAHATCFTMAFAAGLAGAGTPPTMLVTEATYGLETAEGLWRIVECHLDVTGRVEGIDEAAFVAAAEEAKANCVVSQAVKGNVALALRAQLERS